MVWEAAGHDFTEEWIKKLIRELQLVTQSKVQDHRTWLRRNMHKWWPHTVQNDNIQVPPMVRRQQREKRRKQREAQRQRSDPLASLDIPPTPEEAELEALTDVDQPATTAPGSPAHTNSIGVANTAVPRTKPEQQRELAMEEDATEKAVTGQANINEQKGDP
jgi:hypothetical protein